MKLFIPAVLAALAATLAAASAAPRLVVSTPSLAPESKIDLVFDLPVVETTELGKTVENTWLEIKPTLPGKLLWKAQNIAELLPEQPPAIGATYVFSIPKNLRHLDQSPIPAEKITTLESEKFRITGSNSPNKWADDYSPSTAAWTIIFNDDVDPVAAAGFISFASKNGQRVAAKLERATVAQAGYYANNYRSWAQRANGAAPAPATPESLVGNILIASPISPLPPGDGWAVSVLKGLPNRKTNATLQEDTSYEIGKIEPFKVTNIREQVEANEPRKIVISFNLALPETLPADFLTKNIEISPHPENLGVESEKRLLTLTGDFSQSAAYQIKVKSPLASKAGLPLIETASQKVEFKYLEPEVTLPSHDQAQLAEGSRLYRIQTVNIAKLHVRVKKLSGTDLVRAYQGYRNYTGLGPDNQSITPTAPLPYSLVAGETVFEKDYDLQTTLDTSKEVILNWSELLPKELKNATLFLDVTGTPHEGTSDEGRRNTQSLIQLTDIGLAWKITKKEALVYAFSCLTGKPLPGVTLEIYGEDAAKLNTLTSNAEGLATLPRPEAARHLKASLGTDAYLTTFDTTLPTVGMWHFPIRYSWNIPPEEKRRAFLFSDRSLYRPGETVRIKGIIRTQRGNDIEPPAPAKAQLQVLDPTENAIASNEVAISENGSFDFTYTLPASVTGTYNFRLEYPEELAKAENNEDWEEQENIQGNARFNLEVQVEEFRRNAFEIKQSITEPEIGAARITAELSAAYYQGQPVAAGKVKHFTRISAQNPYPERFRDFLFGNHRSEDWHYWYHYFGYRWDEEETEGVTTQNQGETLLTADGKASLSIDIPQADFPTSREVTVSTEVMDANNQTLTAVSKATVHPASVYVGISRNDKLIHTGDQVPLKLVAIDPAGNPFKGAVKLTATLTREVNTAVKSQNEEGATTTSNQAAEETLSTQELTIDPAASAGQGMDFTFSPKANGRHYLTLRGTDETGHAFATVASYYVYGTSEYPWLYEDGLRVKLVSEKKSYKPGDTARVLVLSPIEGTALVTVEREKVLRTFQVQLKADNPLIEIPLTADDAPNAYVSVLIVKGAGESAREHKEPQLRLGYCELIVENQRDRLAISLDTDRKQSAENEPVSYRPGDSVTISGHVTQAGGKPAAGAEVVLYAEDEGTLAVMGYDTPQPMEYFYSPRILGVETGISFESFISEDPENQEFSNKGFFIGGGGDLSKLAELYRKNFDPCATWAPALQCDANGKFTHTFTVPDTLTRYRVIAIAHRAEKFGTQESAIVVKKDLMLEPKTPRFTNQSDTFKPQVLVQNASSYSGTWEVSLATSSGGRSPNVAITGETKQTVTLAPGASATVVFNAISQSTGEAVLVWKATPVSLSSGSLTPELSHHLSDAVESRFPVNYPVPLLRQIEFANLKAGKKQNLLENLDPALLAGDGTLTAEISRSPLVQAAGSIDFLLHYPYGCVEQTTSSLIPWLAVDSLKPYVPAFANIPEEKVKAAVQAGADRLLSMQLPDGSFSYWPGGTQRVDWATSYAGLGLIMASEWGGANVPESAIDLLKKSLIESLRGAADMKSPYELEIHARSLFVLSMAGEPQPAYLNVLKNRMANLTPSARAFLSMAIAISGEENDPANLASAREVLTSKTAFKGRNDDWMPRSSLNAYTLLAWLAIEPEGKEATAILDRLIHERNPYGHWDTTWNNGWALLALAEYADHEDASTESSVVFQTPEGTQNLMLNEESPTTSRTFTLSPDLKLDLTASHGASVRLKLAAKPAIAPLLPAAKNGLSIDRFYERVKSDGSTEILKEPAVGDLIKVTLRVTLPNDHSRYLVIEDPLPAVFETVNSNFKSQQAANASGSEKNWEVSHTELRDDRAVFFLDEVWQKGTYSLSYLARCTLAGQAIAPQAKVESMYDPENVALSASRVFKAN